MNEKMIQNADWDLLVTRLTFITFYSYLFFSKK